MANKRVALLLTGLMALLAGCNAQHDVAADAPAFTIKTMSVTKSLKRGIAYNLVSDADLTALAPGVSWWYDWGTAPSSALSDTSPARSTMDFLPMLWNGNFNLADIESKLRASPQIKYLLVMNEPNLTDQSNLTPAQAADLWPSYEKIAADTGVKIVGPAMNWGTLAGYNDPVVWLDAFYAAYRGKNGSRDPRIDALAFHWYDYGLSGQLDRLKKYGKPFWVTEFANWHSQQDGAQIDTLSKQKAQMADMVANLEARSDVQRYAWFTGRSTRDIHFTSLLGANGQLTELGQYYLSLPFNSITTPLGASCGSTNVALNRPARSSADERAGTPAAAAFDGNTGTRWSSPSSDSQWIQVDLGTSQTICGVTLQWEAAYGKAFKLQVSRDGTTWNDIYTTTTSSGGIQNITPTTITAGQYVRMMGSARGTPYGYSLFEFKVHSK